MEGIDADGDLMRWMKSFLSDSRVGLVIDGHQYEEIAVDTSVPSGSPVSTISFAIYFSGDFKEVEKEVEVCVAMSFADDCG